ncbi:MAG: DUF362 domain-containing protein [Armatimonadetes bacterium]|nr:DUF362 domain-containing protein [Armatimonadota bacterium]
MSKVLFASARMSELTWKQTLPGKLDIILERLDFAEKLKDKKVCVKMHLGGNVGYSTIHPVFVRRVISFIKAAGGKPFITDNLHWVLTAAERGYTPEVLGCPIIPEAGLNDKYVYTHKINYKNLEEFQIAGEIWDSDFLVCLAHAKGHGNSGYGGSIKNIALGSMVAKSRHCMHMVQHAETYWDASKCTHYIDGCNLCVENCKVKCMRFADDKKLHVGFHECNFCLECNEICPQGALSIREEIAHDFQEVMAIATEIVLNRFPNGNATFINFAIDITPLCDCAGMTTPSLVPDIGIFASNDIVAVEKATLDSIDYRNLLPNTIIPWLILRNIEGHLFKKIHGVDPYVQVYACERRGLGSTNYEIEEI